MSRRPKKAPVISQKQSNKYLLLVGNRIKKLRIERGFTSYEYFAYEHNISRSQFGRYEKGEDMRLSSLFKVIDALGITISDFFDEDFDKQETSPIESPKKKKSL